VEVAQVHTSESLGAKYNCSSDIAFDGHFVKGGSYDIIFYCFALVDGETGDSDSITNKS
jgi:hypothetical protein